LLGAWATTANKLAGYTYPSRSFARGGFVLHTEAHDAMADWGTIRQAPAHFLPPYWVRSAPAALRMRPSSRAVWPRGAGAHFQPARRSQRTELIPYSRVIVNRNACQSETLTPSVFTRNAHLSAASSIDLFVGVPAPWPARVSHDAVVVIRRDDQRILMFLRILE
jgi:hypothetical protein